MGSFSSLIEKLPAQFAQAAGQVDDEQAKKQLARTEAIIDSMTPHERRKPEIIKASRKRRIAGRRRHYRSGSQSSAQTV